MVNFVMVVLYWTQRRVHLLVRKHLVQTAFLQASSCSIRGANEPTVVYLGKFCLNQQDAQGLGPRGIGRQETSVRSLRGERVEFSIRF